MSHAELDALGALIQRQQQRIQELEAECTRMGRENDRMCDELWALKEKLQNIQEPLEESA